ncbi:MAG: hypothetical protein F4234_08935, partial [Gammaproteobacteria bacterium]|nr:hypothetical protein [Gammaproteobacteria bacterium]
MPASGTLAFAPGVTEQAIEVAIHDDNLREPSETIDLRLSAPVNAGFAGSATTLDATGTITDDETAPGGLTLSVDLDPNAPGDQTSLAENRSATATVTATLASGVAFTEAKAVTVTVGRAGDTASSADYAAVAPFKIDIPAGAISASETFDFNPVDDSDDEGDETLTVSGAAGGGLSVSPSAIALTLIDDDTRTLSIDSPKVADVAGGSSATLSFTVSLSAASARTVTVDYADTGGGTATAGEDYAKLAKGTLTFKPNQTSQTIDVTVNGDDVAEDEETVILRLFNAVNADLAGGAETLDGTGAITDADAAPALTIDSPSVTEGDAGSATLTFTV